MTARSPQSATAPRLWFAVLGPPASWAVQFATGYWMTEASCEPRGSGWPLGGQLASIALTAVAATTIVAAALTALGIYRATAGAGDADPPPAGRNHFLAIVGLAIAPLFFFIVLMNGVGVGLLSPCTQS